MKLDHIQVTGFKSIHKLDLDLNPLNILIGANGSGKSNFISLFKLLNEIVSGNFQIYVSQSGGADAFLYYGRKETDEITVELNAGQNAYRCSWLPTADNTLIFGSETCTFFGDYVDKKDYLIGRGNRESNLPERAKTNRVARYVLQHLKSWKVYHFHDTSESAPVKRRGSLNDNQYLRTDAGNLAAFLYRMKATANQNYESIRDMVRMVAPFFGDFVLRPIPDSMDQIQLEWRERGSDYPFLAHHLSDGTLRFMCLATLLLQPDLPSTVIVDEPELGLHPYAITLLASIMRSAASRAQLIISTQSVTFVNQFQAQDLLIANRRERATTIERLDEHELANWIDEYSLGELWEKNVIGGRPS
jgi:predicted ATPase